MAADGRVPRLTRDGLFRYRPPGDAGIGSGGNAGMRRVPAQVGITLFFLPDLPAMPAQGKMQCRVLHTDRRRAAKFAGVAQLTLYIPGNTSDGEEETSRIYYIGLRGSHQPVRTVIPPNPHTPSHPVPRSCVVFGHTENIRVASCCESKAKGRAMKTNNNRWTDQKQLPGRPGIILYESAARPQDHKMEQAQEGAGWRPGM
jgi:hypothetical protein